MTVSVKKLVLFLAALVIVISLGYFLYTQNQKFSSPKITQNTQEQDVKDVVAKVGALMVLPNETPITATVSDATKLSDQPFFSDAQNGDKVLMYQNAKEAILYRPSINKIVKVAPLNIETSPTPSASVSPSVTPFEIKSSSGSGR